jgi:hypothetical protein
VHFRYNIGTAIAVARYDFINPYPTTDERGHNGALGKLMEDLIQNLDLSQSTLYDYWGFAEKFGTWDDFADEVFGIRRGDSSSARAVQEQEKDNAGHD